MSEEERGDSCTDSEPQAKWLKLSADTDISSINKKQCIPLGGGSDKELKDGALEEGGDKELKDGALEEGGNKKLKDGVCSSHDLACEDKVEVQTPASSAAVYLREGDVGITEYISSHPGFFAILKQRCSRLISSLCPFNCFLFVCLFSFFPLL